MFDILEPHIELFEYNFFTSLIDYLKIQFNGKKIGNKNIEITPSYFDRNLSYKTPAISTEIMYRRNRSIGFGNIVGEEDIGTKIIEYEGALFEYRIQLNVYSNTGGENLQLSSLLDEVLKNGESGIPLNTYDFNGRIKQHNIGNISYDFASDVGNNPMAPNIKTYDYYTIYEVKMASLQKYKIIYDIMEIGDIIGKIKRGGK